MDDLRAAVQGFKAGKKLLDVINEASNRDSVATAVLSVLKEASASVGKLSGKENGVLVPAAHEAPAADFSKACAVIEKLNFINPWGKHDVGIFEKDRIVLRGKGDISVPFSAMNKVAIFDNIPKDTKRRVLVVLHLDLNANVISGKKRLDGVVIQTTADAQLDIPFPNPAGRLQGLAVVVLCQMLGAMGVPATAFCSPTADVFRTSSGMLGMIANVKANSGILYPMAGGFCFLEKPPMFIPLETIKSADFLRASGPSSTFDLQLFLRDGNVMEFSSMAKEDVAALQRYVGRQGLALGAADEDGAAPGDAGPAGNPEPDDSDSEEDSDFDPENPDSYASEGPAGSRGRRRKPKPSDPASATEADDEEDGEEEEEEGEGEGSEVSSDGSDSDVSLESDDEISASKVRQLVVEERQANTKKQRTK